MKFNTKYIFKGDDRKEIVDKINYNFNQILSFSVGPDGHQGPRGATGLPGPAGYKGEAGGSGDRGTIFFKQSSAPEIGLSQEYDIWIDNSTGEGSVNFLDSNGDWIYSGYSFFSSSYFSNYSWIQGPASSTDKYVIGLKNNGDLEKTSLVLSDGSIDPSYSNPNKSKLVIATKDQTSYPILSFSKSSSTSNGIPSFYWENIGSNRNLVYKSSGNLEIKSNLILSIDSGAARNILFGNNFSSNSSDFVIKGDGNFYLSSNVTIGSGGIFGVTSKNLLLSSLYLVHSDPTVIYSETGSYVMNDVPQSGGLNSGIVIATTSSADESFRIDDLTGNPILSGKPSGTVDSGKHAQTIFGSTGGATGGTGGPFSYHVKKASYVTKNTSAVLSVAKYPSNTLGSTVLNNVFDLSDASLWNSNVIVVTPTFYTAGDQSGIYLRIPSSYLNVFDPVYSTGKSNTYRILLNNLDSDPNSRYIQGLVFNYTSYGSGGLTSNTILSYLDLSPTNFPTGTLLINSATDGTPTLLNYSINGGPFNFLPQTSWTSCQTLTRIYGLKSGDVITFTGYNGNQIKQMAIETSMCPDNGSSYSTSKSYTFIGSNENVIYIKAKDYTGGAQTTTTTTIAPIIQSNLINKNRFCQYIDLHWLGIANTTNLNPRLFYKASNGIGGFVDLTNLNSLGSSQPITSGGSSPTSSGYNSSSSSSSSSREIPYCPTPDMLIYMGEDKWKSAGELVVGDLVYTPHEITNIWDYYKVKYTQRAFQDVISVVIGGKEIKVSEMHRFLTPEGDYIPLIDLNIGSSVVTLDGISNIESKKNIGLMEVVKIEVENAHTYVLEGAVSHNIKPPDYLDPDYNGYNSF